MEFLEKDGITLAYEDSGTDLPPLVLVHGCGCDHSSLASQAAFFGNSHRVVSVDLRGHGESDAPQAPLETLYPLIEALQGAQYLAAHQ
jgi:pimeloyl-ACP methyl ester carboxylesterase